MDREEFGKWLNEKRVNAGLKKRQASLALGYKNIGTIHAVEQGVTPLPWHMIHPVCQLYKIELSEMLSKLAAAEPDLFKKYSDFRDDILRNVLQDVGVTEELRHNFG